jgi:hypothetical protein
MNLSTDVAMFETVGVQSSHQVPVSGTVCRGEAAGQREAAMRRVAAQGADDFALRRFGGVCAAVGHRAIFAAVRRPFSLVQCTRYGHNMGARTPSRTTLGQTTSCGVVLSRQFQSNAAANNFLSRGYSYNSLLTSLCAMHVVL